MFSRSMINAMAAKLSKGESVRRKIRAHRLPRRPYKTVAIGLYEDQARSIDNAIRELQEAGYVKANRSLVFQTLARRFLQDTEGMDSQQILDYFLKTPVKRPLSRLAARNQQLA